MLHMIAVSGYPLESVINLHLGVNHGWLWWLHNYDFLVPELGWFDDLDLLGWLVDYSLSVDDRLQAENVVAEW